MNKPYYVNLFQSSKFDYDPEVKDEYLRMFMRQRMEPGLLTFRRQMATLGVMEEMSTTTAPKSEDMVVIVSAFQAVYRHEEVTGFVDKETTAILYAMVDHYLVKKAKGK